MGRLFDMNRRDGIGMGCWLAMSVLVGLVALPLMVAREVYQWKHYKLSRFELEDVARYGLVILLGCAIHYPILAYGLKVFA